MLLISQIGRLVRRSSLVAPSTSTWNKVVMSMAIRALHTRSARPDHRIQTEEWQETLDNYRHKAVLTFELHRTQGGNCAACGQHWPCNRALAAEQMLGL
jgi:hypothetical protein